MKKHIALILSLAFLVQGCYKPMDTEANPIPGNTLVLEFAAPIGYVMDLSIDGESVPIRFIKKNRVLWIEGLTPGVHTFNIHSISYVFGPEFQSYKVDDNRGAYLFIQQRKYRSGLPKAREQVSIRAYRRKLKKDGIDVKQGVEIGAAGKNGGRIKAYFTRK